MFHPLQAMAGRNHELPSSARVKDDAANRDLENLS
jgi:hypothetical protein